MIDPHDGHAGLLRRWLCQGQPIDAKLHLDIIHSIGVSPGVGYIHALLLPQEQLQCAICRRN